MNSRSVAQLSLNLKYTTLPLGTSRHKTMITIEACRINDAGNRCLGIGSVLSYLLPKEAFKFALMLMVLVMVFLWHGKESHGRLCLEMHNLALFG